MCDGCNENMLTLRGTFVLLASENILTATLILIVIAKNPSQTHVHDGFSLFCSVSGISLLRALH